MKKPLFAFLFSFILVSVHAQYTRVNAILDRLEQKRGINQNLKNISLTDAKFILIKDFDDHIERDFVILKDQNATYVEVFEDKKTGQTNSNVFSGSVVRSNKQIVSVHADLLEGKKIPIPLSKTYLLTEQKGTLYLIDINSKERWIEESAINNKR